MGQKRVVIVGGGLSGLLCGALLAKRGKQVTILEKHLTVGGLAAGFRRKGYYFDSAMARLIADSSRGYFEELGIWDKVDFRPHRASLHLEGRMFNKLEGPEQFFAACAEVFPESKTQLHDFYRTWIKEYDAFMQVNAATGPTSYSGFAQVTRTASMMMQLLAGGHAKSLKTISQSFNIHMEELAARYFDRSSKLYALFADPRFDVFNKGGKPSLMSFAGALSANYRLNQYPYQGFQAMCDHIADVVRQHGGEIIVSASVRKIQVEGQQAKAVSYAKAGQETTLPADVVISAIDLQKTYLDLLERDQSDPKFVGSITAQPATNPVAFLYLGLKLSPEVLRLRLGNANEVIFYPRLTRGSDIAEQDFFKFAPQVIHSSSMDNPEHAPQGCSSVQLYLASPDKSWMNNWGRVNGQKTEAYTKLKQSVIEDVLSNLEAVIPELANRDIIEVCELGTPYTTERFTGNTGGAHSGFTWDRQLNQVNQGMGKTRVRHERINNLYLIGHWTGYMGGVTNAFLSARQAAQQIR